MLYNNQRSCLVLFPFKVSGKKFYPAIPFLKNQYFRLKNEPATEPTFIRIKKNGLPFHSGNPFAFVSFSQISKIGLSE
jgi:hypothetical protein